MTQHMIRILPRQSQTGSTLGTHIFTVGDAVANKTKVLYYGVQDLVETDAAAGAERWPVWKSLALIALASLGFWALIFVLFRALIN